MSTPVMSSPGPGGAAGAAGAGQRGRRDVRRSRPGRIPAQRRIRQRQGGSSVHRQVRGRRVEAGRAGHSVRHAASAADTGRRRRLGRGRGLRRAPRRRPGHLRRRPAADPHVGPGRPGTRLRPRQRSGVPGQRG
jgi:hypothetical protein